jgi:hypothetical protein
MIFYNGFNLLVDIILAFIVWRLSYSEGHLAGYNERDAQIQFHNEAWQDYYSNGDMRDK